MVKKYLILIIAIAATFLGCNKSSVKQINYAHGRPGDIIVIMSNERWNSEPGDSLRVIFHQDVPGLPMEEMLFDLHQIPREKFVEANRHHKNTIYTEINPDIEKSAITVTNNKYAVNQVFVHIKAKNQMEFIQLVEEHGNSMINLFLEADRNRWLSQHAKFKNDKVSDRLTKEYDIKINIPKSYKGDAYRKNFVWIANETRNYTMNILVYTYSITDSTEFNIEYLIEKRNEILKENIPGSNPGSYMTTETKYDFPLMNVMMHNGMSTAVVRGLWKVKGDFMGGPFVSYTKIDEMRGRVVTVEGFAYHPNEETRDQIRELESVLYTFDFVK
jgi:hypothetical protein